MMAQQRAGSRVVAMMWIAAAVLAWLAVAIRYFGGGGVNWSVAAGGLFCAVMGIGAWTRAKASVGPGAAGPRVPPGR
jgi:hypothetical protein